MEIENNFEVLIETLKSLYRNVLLRKFFFSFLNIHYETTIFKALPTLTKPKSVEKAAGKSKEEVKIDNKVEEALEVAKKAWTGIKPTEVKKGGLKRPTDISKKEVTKKEEAKKEENLKREEAKKKAADSKISAAKKTQGKVSEYTKITINPLEFFNVTSVLINPELMEKYQDMKARFNSSLYSNLGGLSQGKKAEATAKKNFLTKLNKKFTSKNIRSEVENSVIVTYATYKILNEILKFINDEELIQSFFEISAKPLQNFRDSDERSMIFKASFILNWIQTCLTEIQGANFQESVAMFSEFKSIIGESEKNSEKIKKFDGFLTEKLIKDELMKTCTKDEVKEVIEKYRHLDKWRVTFEVNKFISQRLSTTKSLPGLRVLHSLGCKNGRTFCTFTNK